MRNDQHVCVTVEESLFFFSIQVTPYMASIFLMISLVNSEHLALPPKSPVMKLPSFITWNKEELNCAIYHIHSHSFFLF